MEMIGNFSLLTPYNDVRNENFAAEGGRCVDFLTFFSRFYHEKSARMRYKEQFSAIVDS